MGTNLKDRRREEGSRIELNMGLFALSIESPTDFRGAPAGDSI